MKHFVIALLALFFSTRLPAQAVITKPTSAASAKTIGNFGAIPNDGIDDTWAFIKAGKYFSNLWDINGVPLTGGAVNFSYATNSAELLIPSGTYLVGKQVSVPSGGLSTTYGAIFGYSAATAPVTTVAGHAYLLGLDVFPLDNVDEIVVKGTGITPPIIKYNDNLVIGYFDNSGNPLFFPPTAYDGKYGVTVGGFLQAINSRNVYAEKIEVDGNNIPTTSGGTTLYNGGWVGHLIQMGASGAYLVNTQNVTIKDMYIHHMTIDGIILADYYKDPATYPGQPLSNVLIDNTICDYNRRQGFSWVGGRNITVTNSKFNNTGKTVSGLAAGNPGAGLDIEPELDPWGNSLWCIDGTFTNCEFINNSGLAMANDYANFSQNMNFNNCKFQDVESLCVWVRGKAYTFNDCQIWGSFVNGNASGVAGEETIFNRCDFADEELPAQPGVYSPYPLVESWLAAKRMRFSYCTFRMLHPDKDIVRINTNSSLEADLNVFSNCSFTASTVSSGRINYLFGCTFDGNNKITNTDITNYIPFYSKGLVFTGSNDPCTPYNFEFNGKVLIFPANSGSGLFPGFIVGRKGIGTNAMDGFADFNIGANSCLYAYLSQDIDIGQNAKLINRPGGQFAIISGNLNNAGKVILDNNSHTAFFTPLNINTATTGNPEFYYHKNASMGLNSYWSTVLVGLGAGVPMSSNILSPNTTFDGGNTSIPPGTAASVNEAVDFDGVNDYIEVLNPSPSSKLSTYGSGAFSIEIAFKRDQLYRTEYLFNQGGRFEIGISNTNYIFYTLPDNSGTPVMTVINAFSIIGNPCHFLTLTREADNYIRVYLDGEHIYTSGTTYTANPASRADINIGAFAIPSRARGPFDGWIGQVRLWNRALTQQDICYNHTRKVGYNTSNLIADWDMTDASGTTVTDAAASPVNGTLMNGAAWVSQFTAGDCTNSLGNNNGGYINNFAASDGPQPAEASEVNIEPGLYMNVSPNPSSGELIIKVKGALAAGNTIHVYDANGRLVLEQKFNNNKGESFTQKINIKARGLYYIKLNNGNRIYTRKVTIL